MKSYALASLVAFSIAFITDDDVGFVGLIIDLVTVWPLVFDLVTLSLLALAANRKFSAG